MKLPPFRLEQFLSEHEFITKYTLSSSDCESADMHELVRGADAECVSLWENLKLGYTQPAGLPLLRDAISAQCDTIASTQILVTSSAQEAIYIVLQSLLEKGDHAIFMPGYQGQYAIAQAMGCDVSFWKPDSEAVFDVQDLLELIRTDTKLLFLCFPHNPTGYVPTGKQFREIMEFARAKNVRVVCDEIYRFLEPEEQDRLKAVAEVDENAVSISGTSKVFGMPGLRIGWIATKDKKLLKDFEEYRNYTTICSSAPSEILSLMALRMKNTILKKNLAILTENKRSFDAFLQRHPDRIRCQLPVAGSVCLARILCEKSSKLFSEKTLQAANIMIIPSEFFDLGDKHIRIGLGRKSFPHALDVFENYLEKHYR